MGREHSFTVTYAPVLINAELDFQPGIYSLNYLLVKE